MSLLRQVALLIICIVGILLLEAWQQGKNQLELDALNDGKELSQATSTVLRYASIPQFNLQNGYVNSRATGTSFPTSYLESLLRLAPDKRPFASFYLTEGDQSIINFAATGIDNRTYFANSFLVGYVPFQTKRVWIPLATLAAHKRYRFDHQQYGATLQDIWQNSYQAYKHSHGDCEDHALILADWLIGLGYDAKVAVGETPDGGHAWVLLSLNGNDYVLESTRKRKPISVKDFKLAGLATDYHPKFLFNRSEFWINTSSIYTTKYSGKGWVLSSRFERY